MTAKLAPNTSDLNMVWKPLNIGATRVRNRTMMSAMGVFYGENNLLSDRHIAYYRERARGGYVEYGHRARKIVGNRAKLFLVGRVTGLDEAEVVLQSGAADMVAMTRAQFADPHLVKKTKEGRGQEIIHCIGANECVARIFDNRPAACLVTQRRAGKSGGARERYCRCRHPKRKRS